MIIHRKLKYLNKPSLIWAIVFLLFLMFSLCLNIQFLEGSNIHKEFQAHDEYLVIRDVYSILQPLSVKHFILAISSGNVLYYGRIMFYIDALIAYLPFKLFGISGMVLAIRMFHSIVLFWAIWVLAKNFIRNSKNQLFFVLTILSLYYTTYYLMIPKPEPLQLLFLAYFLKLFKDNYYKFGFYFVLLGISFGIKINVLPIILFILIVAFIYNQKNIIFYIRLICTMILGVLIAVPCLILGVAKPVLFSSYFSQTFGNTGHFDDVSTINAADWFYNVISQYYLGNTAIAFIVSILLIIIISSTIKNRLLTLRIDAEVIVLFISFLLLFPVIFFTKDYGLTICGRV